ncbi:MAG: DUF4384 domain-containing protein [Leptospiraceae bacterium]|nr:DUF4384 domain-containing protein [Leptospiraceae bacterium]MCP5498428.1 DUF4384 domain-containing protein [Leptospiraceae bacterium]
MIKIFFLLLFIAAIEISAAPILQNGKFSIAVLGDKPELVSNMEKAFLETEYIQPIDRKKIQALMKEIKLGQAGITTGAPEAGKMLGASYFVVFEKNSVAFKLIESETAKVLGSWDSYTKRSLNQLLQILEINACLYELLSLKSGKYKSDIEIYDVFSIASEEYEGVVFNEKINIEYKLRSKKQKVYITILAYFSDGTLIQLFPNRFHKDNLLESNKEHKFPPENTPEAYNLLAGEPAGVDTVILIASESPVGLPSNYLEKFDIYSGTTTNKVHATKGMRISLEKIKGKYDIQRIRILVKDKK